MKKDKDIYSSSEVKRSREVTKSSSRQARTITTDTLFSVIVREYPYLSRILLSDYGLHCTNCFANGFDTIASGARVHGMTEEEMLEMLEHLNSEIKRHIASSHPERSEGSLANSSVSNKLRDSSVSPQNDSSI